MKAMIILAILATLGLVAIDFHRHRDWKRLLISLGIFGFVLTLAGLGNMLRTVIPIFIAHFVLIVIAWGALLIYIFRGKLYWPVILSPLVTIILFILMERVIGSGGAGG
ncbi:MAG: hypothetical protein DRG30_06855 [Epsilonproteobacteria bacterium]|nr:MAG: hypothetical protein DRG30_06855 [Campylobacterota bacterium]